jgi:glycosyltransferase involved in cell wall biosynthesis
MQNPKISVIVPFSRGIKELSQLLRDFRNQTFRNFELIVVRDGNIPDDIQNYINLHKKENPNVIFTSIKKDRGNMKDAPGTNPRNYGISIAKGEFSYFFDDDDRASDKLLETLSNSHDNVITVVQMACQESRIYRDGNPDNIVLIPEIDLQAFPVICHVGTPCFTVRTEWAKAEPWRHEPEHDFRFIKRIYDRFHPQVQIIGGMAVDVDGKTLRGLRDWVSFPPFYRGQ